MRRLNLGCGVDTRLDCVNLDWKAYPGVDVVHDLRRRLPFADESFDEILAFDIIEHVGEYNRLLREIHRVLAPGGSVLIRVPHFTSRNNFSDPTHRHQFSARLFEWFVKSDRAQDELYKERLYSSCEVKILFLKRWQPWNIVLEWFVNLGGWSRELYELTPLRVFPAGNLSVRLTK